jgi:CDP-diglyceride synthetase
MDDERRDEDVNGSDAASAAPPGRVRIIGAEAVGTGETPAVGSSGTGEGSDSGTGGSSGSETSEGGWTSGLGLSGPGEAAGGTTGAGLDDDVADWAPAPSEAELPHWTEAPTGEVPAVVARDRGEGGEAGDPWASVPAPTWREEHSDWDAHDDAYEPSMLARDDRPTMSDRHESLDEERQPWTFDLSSSSGASGASGADAPSGDGDDLFAGIPGISGTDTGIGDDDAGTGAAAAPRDDLLDDDTVMVPSIGALASTSAAPLEDAGATADEADDNAGDKGEDAGSEPATPDEGDDPRVAGPTGILPASLRSRLRRRGRGADAYDDVPVLPESARPVPPAPSAGTAAGAGAAAAGAAAAGAVAGAAAGAATVAATPTLRPKPVPLAPEQSTGDALIVRRIPSIRPPVPPTPPGKPTPKGGDTPSEHGGRDLPIAVIAGVILGVAVIIAFDLGTVLAMVVVTAVMFVATIEALTAFRRAGHRPAVLLGWVATVSLMIASYNKGLVALPLLVVLTTALTMLWYMAGVERGADPVRGTADTLFVFCWIGVFGSYAALLLNPTLFPNRHGLAFLMGAIICTVAYDVAALAVGSSIGSRSLAPSISPGKTWEGAIGGGVAAVLAGVVIVHFMHPWTPGSAAVLGLVVAVVAPLGDLFESVVKRYLGMKDMGRVLPGHGGILDRVDGLLFVLPATYYLVKAFHLG